jgi:hypothetical protein
MVQKARSLRDFLRKNGRNDIEMGPEASTKDEVSKFPASQHLRIGTECPPLDPVSQRRDTRLRNGASLDSNVVEEKVFGPLL